MQAKIIDTAQNSTRFLPELERMGVRTVLRYYNHSNSRTLPEKCLTREEAQTLSAHGFGIGVVFQQYGRDISNFTAAAGRKNAKRALYLASQRIGQPSDSGIYFAVDHDFHTKADIETIAGFFAAINDIFAEHRAGGGETYHIGCYASGRICHYLLERNLARFFWLPRALGWSDSREFHASGAWHLFQNRIDLTDGSFSYDTNLFNPAMDEFGAFILGRGGSRAAPAPRENAAIHRPLFDARRYVIARSGLTLRGGPGSEYAPLEILPYGTEVIILGSHGEWTLVDIEGDGRADGFCHNAFLAPGAF